MYQIRCDFLLPSPSLSPDPATVNTTLPSVIAINKSSNVTLKCNGTGLPLPKLFWYRNGVQITDNIREVVTSINGELIRTSFIVLSDVDITTNGVYSCLGVNNVTNLIDVLDIVSIRIIVQGTLVIVMIACLGIKLHC